jgi:hypothetical protein
MSYKIYKISIIVTNCKKDLSFKNYNKDSAFSWIIVCIMFFVTACNGSLVDNLTVA